MMLNYNTVTPFLKEVLATLMQAPQLEIFQLTGDTSISLQQGHRLAMGIELAVDRENFHLVDWPSIDKYFNKTFPYVEACAQPRDWHYSDRSVFLGDSQNKRVKVDLFRTERFITEGETIDGIRFASLEDLAAMKLNAVNYGGRMRDFWDLHELWGTNFSAEGLVFAHRKHYDPGADCNRLIQQLTNFELADRDLPPVCLRGKHWELIKSEFMDVFHDLQWEGGLIVQRPYT